MCDCIWGWVGGVCNVCCVWGCVGGSRQRVIAYHKNMSTDTIKQILAMHKITVSKLRPFSTSTVSYRNVSLSMRRFKNRFTKHVFPGRFARHNRRCVASRELFGVLRK